jgi:arabinofuranosyltransferase
MELAKSIACLVIVLAVILPVALWMRAQVEAADVGVDDANIFFVYARHLADGRGFVWNTGGPRVEGFSSPLWLLLMTVLFLVSSAPEPLLFFAAVGLVALGLSTALCYLLRCLLSRCDTNAAGLLTGLAVLLAWALSWFAQPMFLFWTTLTLMETGLWTAVLLLATTTAAWCAARPNRDRAPALLWALTPVILLTRPEGLLLAPALLCAEAAAQWLAGKPLERWTRHTLLSCVVYAVSLGAITGLRLLYFGYPLPNTYYAKVSPDRMYNLSNGFQYFREFLLSQRSLPILAVFVLLLVVAFAVSLVATSIRRLARTDTPAPPPHSSLLISFVFAASAFAGLVAPILEGGDHFDGFRFYQPVWPLLPIPLAAFLHYLFAGTPVGRRMGAFRPLAVAAAVIVALGGWMLFAPDIPSWRNIGARRLVDEFRLAKEGRSIGQSLNRVFADWYPEVGAIAVGGIQYTYKGNVNDLMGLSNVEIAHHPGERKGIKNHAAFSKEVFFRQKPAVMIPISLPVHARETLGRPVPPDFAKYLNHRWVLEPLQGLPRDPAFRSLYTPAMVSRSDSAAPESIAGFIRNDILESLGTNAMYVVSIFDS